VFPPGLWQPGSKEPLTSERLLIVEGKHAWRFFKALLQHLGLLDKVEIRNYGGVNELAQYLKTLSAISGFRDVHSLGIVRDAEANSVDSFRAVCGALEQARHAMPRLALRERLAVPTSPMTRTPGDLGVAVFILPDCEKPGMLETICLASVKDDPATPCLQDYFACLSRCGLPPTGNMTKARLQAFLSSREKPDLLLGEAAEKGYFPWDSQVFTPLKNFLSSI